MSKIGKKPVAVPSGVDVTLSNGTIKTKGPAGELSLQFHPNMQVEFDAAAKEVRIVRPNDERQNKALHGLTRSLINNMVKGVKEPFMKKLEITGVGYNAQIAGKKIKLQVGYANTIELEIPAGVTCEVPQPTEVIVKGADKQKVGQFAAEIRNVRPPEPYKLKGIKYQGEYVRRKAGKAFGAK
jgi:large subunit ribosomal protein L6